MSGVSDGCCVLAGCMGGCTLFCRGYCLVRRDCKSLRVRASKKHNNQAKHTRDTHDNEHKIAI